MVISLYGFLFPPPIISFCQIVAFSYRFSGTDNTLTLLPPPLFFFFKDLLLFISFIYFWLLRVLVEDRGLLSSCGRHVGSSLTRDWTRVFTTSFLHLTVTPHSPDVAYWPLLSIVCGFILSPNFKFGLSPLGSFLWLCLFPRWSQPLPCL